MTQLSRLKSRSDLVLFPSEIFTGYFLPVFLLCAVLFAKHVKIAICVSTKPNIVRVAALSLNAKQVMWQIANAT
jgi:hypothetical protein